MLCVRAMWARGGGGRARPEFFRDEKYVFNAFHVPYVKEVGKTPESLLNETHGKL